MIKKLQQGPNDLSQLIDDLVPLEEILIKGRYLQSSIRHDRGGEPDSEGYIPHMHWYRKILNDFNLEVGTVLLSKEGSRRLLPNLEVPDREYSISELYCLDWQVRESDHDLF